MADAAAEFVLVDEFLGGRIDTVFALDDRKQDRGMIAVQRRDIIEGQAGGLHGGAPPGADETTPQPAIDLVASLLVVEFVYHPAAHCAMP